MRRREAYAAQEKAAAAAGQGSGESAAPPSLPMPPRQQPGTCTHCGVHFGRRLREHTRSCGQSVQPA